MYSRNHINNTSIWSKITKSTDLEKINTKTDHNALIPHRGEPSNDLDPIYRLPSKM